QVLPIALHKAQLGNALWEMNFGQAGSCVGGGLEIANTTVVVGCASFSCSNTSGSTLAVVVPGIQTLGCAIGRHLHNAGKQTAVAGLIFGFIQVALLCAIWCMHAG